MSPEQARGDLDRLGPRSDVYSLGATLYCLLTGRPPFEGDDIGEMLRKVQRGEFARPRQLDPSIDQALEAVCLKAMATEARGPLRLLPRAGRGPGAVDGRRAGLGVARAVDAETRALAHAAPHRRHRRRGGGAGRRGRPGRRARRAGAGQRPAPSGQHRTGDRQRSRHGGQRRVEVGQHREKQRFDLAMEAIKLFHGEVGDDLVLKADQFKPLRDKLLRGRGRLLRQARRLAQGSDRPRLARSMGNAYFELGDLTAKIGDQAAALEAHRKGLAIRRELASEPADDVEARLDVARSLHAAGVLVLATARTVRGPRPLRGGARPAREPAPFRPGFPRSSPLARPGLHPDRGPCSGAWGRRTTR